MRSPIPLIPQNSRIPRFTFVVDRTNRTAVAQLLGALETVVEDVSASLRTTSPESAPGLEFDRSGGFAECVCMSAMTENFGAVASLLGAMRSNRAEFLSVCGGPHATADPESILAAGFDVACIGEGEAVLRSLARHLAAGESVPGREVLKGAPIDLETLPPLPEKTHFPAHIEIGRGCRWRCSYCQTPRIFGHGERFRSPAVVEAAIARYAALGMKDFRLLLPNALGYMSDTPGVPNCGMLEELLERVTRAAAGKKVFLGFFPSEVRPDYVTPEAAGVLKRFVANRQLVIGAQSGSQRILDAVGRGHTVNDVERACAVTVDHGFLPSVDLMFGFPTETGEDREATFDLLERLRRAGAIINMHFFMPLPGTPLAGALPTFLADADRGRLEALARKGVIRGRWTRQEEIAREWSLGR
jgi:B12-binding domain/radical SAM domain protein